MTFSFDTAAAQGAVIKVIGVGGGNLTCLNRMVDEEGVGIKFIAANTRCTSPEQYKAENCYSGPK